jgi:outer membrane protein assembly factor BamB
MIVALNKFNGETIWKLKTPEVDQPASPPSGERTGRRVGAEASSGNSRRTAAARPASVEGNPDAKLYASEHWGMNGFNQKLPNGRYVVNLHFAETYQGITAAGQRVFGFTVQGTKFEDFDIWAKTGGSGRVHVESVPAEVTDGELKITFERKVENPAIKAIEILPQGNDDAPVIRVNAGASESYTDSKNQEWSANQGFVGGQANPGSFGMSRSRQGRGFGSSGGADYSSVIVAEIEGVRQYVQMTSKALVGVAADSGKLLWQYDRPSNRMGINCSTPIYQDGLLFAASAYGAGGGAVRLTGKPDGTFDAEEVYFTSNMQNHHGGMIVVDGALYGANGGNGGGFMACIDFQTGEMLWRDRSGPKGSLAFADDRLYLRSEEGPIVLIEPSKDGLIERGRFDQPDRTSVPAWAHPVIANGKLYIRDQGMLLCYDISSSKN